MIPAVRERTSNWRVMGRWFGGPRFLVVLGDSQHDCRRRLAEALSGYSRDDLERVDALWFEEWRWDEDLLACDWIPTSILPLRGPRCRKAYALSTSKSQAAPQTELKSEERTENEEGSLDRRPAASGNAAHLWEGPVGRWSFSREDACQTSQP